MYVYKNVYIYIYIIFANLMHVGKRKIKLDGFKLLFRGKLVVHRRGSLHFITLSRVV